jgi:hypothetical protein
VHYPEQTEDGLGVQVSAPLTTRIPVTKPGEKKKRYGWQGQVMGLLMGTRSTDMFAWEQSKRFHGFDVNFRGIRLRGVCLLCRQLELASLRVNNRNNSNKFVACVQ